jgi:hypothetical protein
VQRRVADGLGRRLGRQVVLAGTPESTRLSSQLPSGGAANSSHGTGPLRCAARTSGPRSGIRGQRRTRSRARTTASAGSLTRADVAHRDDVERADRHVGAPPTRDAREPRSPPGGREVGLEVLGPQADQLVLRAHELERREDLTRSRRQPVRLEPGIVERRYVHVGHRLRPDVVVPDVVVPDGDAPTRPRPAREGRSALR